MDVNDIAQHLHWTAPVVAASPIYALFKFLDKKASQAANRAVTAWLKGERYKRIDLMSAVVEGFDHYTGRLCSVFAQFIGQRAYRYWRRVAYIQ
jgi:hypothetical protein